MAGVLVLGVVLFAPLAKAADDKVIVVGQAIDLSGPNGSIGRDYVAGITTYFDSINVKGGIDGRKVRYIARDDHGVPAEAATLTTELITQDRADYLLGGIGTDSTIAAIGTRAFKESRHVLFAPLADSLALPGTRAMFWRPGVERELAFLLDYFAKLGIKKVGVALQNTPANKRTFDHIATDLQRRGIALTGVAHIGGPAATLAQESRKLSASGPKLVLAIADTVSMAQFLKEFRRNDPATFVAGTSLTNLSMLWEIAGAKSTDFTVFSQVVPNPGSGASALQSEHIAMMRKFRDEPVSALTLEGFAVAKTLARAIQAGGSLQRLSVGKPALDVGGMTLRPGSQGVNLSSYVDIAMFTRGGGLKY